jgi:hypothetical protein
MAETLPSCSGAAALGGFRLAVGVVTRLLGRGFDRAVEDCLLAGELTGPAHRLAFLASCLLGGLFIKAPSFHFTKDALPLHLLFQDAESLVDIVVADENLQLKFLYLEGSAAAAQRSAGLRHVRCSHPVVAACATKPPTMD